MNRKKISALLLPLLLQMLLVGGMSLFCHLYRMENENVGTIQPELIENTGKTERTRKISKEKNAGNHGEIPKLSDEPTQLYAKSAVLMDGESGRILYGKEADIIRPMASTTKIMTCILTLEYLKKHPEQSVVVSGLAASQPKVHLGMQKGERYYLRDLLYSLMLESHNDSAVAVAEGVAGTVKNFTEMMNQKARSLGCRNTHFVTPNGLDAEDSGGMHATTARELARIMRYCMKQSEVSDEFLRITGTRTYQFQDLDHKRNFSCQNHNAFLDMMEGAVSGKTGFTGDAGYCYVGGAVQEKRVFIVALLACGWPDHREYKWKDTMQLMRYGMSHYQYKELKREKVPDLPKVTVMDGFDEDEPYRTSIYVPLDIEKNGNLTEILLRDGEKIEKRVSVPAVRKAPVKKGEIMGTISYRLNGEEICHYKVLAGKTVIRKNYGRILVAVLKKASLY